MKVKTGMEHYRRMLRAKIHRATVTEANPDYEGSLTLPPALMEAADIREYEAIHVWNVTRGTRLETYAIAGVKESGGICVNGLVFPDVPESAVTGFRPTIVFVDGHNAVVRTGTEVAGPHTRGDGC
jgi:aspartate 1-decarboxylase